MSVDVWKKDEQYQFFRTIMPESDARMDALPMDNLDVRIIAVSNKNLAYPVRRKEFDKKLFYALQGLVPEIPSLNQRPEDLHCYFEKYFKACLQRYNKYFVLTRGAYERLKKLPWDGNLIQLQSFCERLVIFSHRRSIDEVKLQKLFDSLYPYVDAGEEKIIVYKSQEAEALAEILKKNRGSRRKTAEELGISTTTLWRRMKEYGIESLWE